MTRAEDQIKKLSEHLIEHYPDWLRGEGAVDTAIEILGKQAAHEKGLRKAVLGAMVTEEQLGTLEWQLKQRAEQAMKELEAPGVPVPQLIERAKQALRGELPEQAHAEEVAEHALQRMDDYVEQAAKALFGKLGTGTWDEAEEWQRQRFREAAELIVSPPQYLTIPKMDEMTEEETAAFAEALDKALQRPWRIMLTGENESKED